MSQQCYECNSQKEVYITGHEAHLDVCDGVLQHRLDDGVERVDAAVGGLDGLVQRQERGLQAGQLHQQRNGRQVRLPRRLRAGCLGSGLGVLKARRVPQALVYRLPVHTQTRMLFRPVLPLT